MSATLLSAVMLFAALPLALLGVLYCTGSERRYALRSILLGAAALLFWLAEAVSILLTRNMVSVFDDRDRLLVIADFVLVVLATVVGIVLAARARRRDGWSVAAIVALALSVLNAAVLILFSVVGMIVVVGFT